MRWMDGIPRANEMTQNQENKYKNDCETFGMFSVVLLSIRLPSFGHAWMFSKTKKTKQKTKYKIHCIHVSKSLASVP